MASKSEKNLEIEVGFAIGLIQGNIYSKKTDAPIEKQLRYTLGGGLTGSTPGYLSALLLGSPNNTLNYRLFKNKKFIYHSITYEDRLIKMSNEHLMNGLMFDKVLKDEPKSKTDALILEMRKIRRHRPFYNIQHNI